ncbi:MAG: DUF5063 domain-containing protein [Candidatus Sulfotelmatobacter sp.]
MNSSGENAQIADRFSVIAYRFCSTVDAVSTLDRTDLLSKLYRILSALISEAIGLPDVSRDDDDELEGMSKRGFHIGGLTEQEWGKLYNCLKEKLGDWDLYHQVFDPTKDTEAIFGSLADDIADIYRDLKKGLALGESHQSLCDEDAIWTWRLLFYSHWGQHAMQALHAIHFRLQQVLA